MPEQQLLRCTAVARSGVPQLLSALCHGLTSPGHTASKGFPRNIREWRRDPVLKMHGGTASPGHPLTFPHSRTEMRRDGALVQAP